MSKGFMCISKDKLDSWRWRGNMAKNYAMMYLLCKANYKDDWFEKTKVCRGQLIFSYDKLSAEMGMPLQTLRTTLRDLAVTKQIKLEPTRKWTLLTICEYDDWRGDCQISNMQSVTIDGTEKNTLNDNKIINNKDNNKEKESNDSSKKEKPLWKESFEEWKRLFEEARVALIADAEFKAQQEHLYPNIDYERSIDKSLIYWLQEDVWKKVKKERTENILPAQRIKKNFDKNKVFRPLGSQNNQTQEEPSLNTKFEAFLNWLHEHRGDEGMMVYHITVDDYREMRKAYPNSNEFSKVILKLTEKPINEKLINVFRKYQDTLC